MIEKNAEGMEFNIKKVGGNYESMTGIVICTKCGKEFEHIKIYVPIPEKEHDFDLSDCPYLFGCPCCEGDFCGSGHIFLGYCPNCDIYVDFYEELCD